MIVPRHRAHFGWCLALLGTFVIGNLQCGGEADDYYQVSVRHLELGEFQRSLAAARQSLQLDRSRVDAYLVAALAQLGLEESAAAFDMLRRGLLIAPDDERLYATMRDIAGRLQRFDLLLLALEQAATQVDDEGLLSMIGWTYVQLEQDEKGLALLQAAFDAGRADAFVISALSEVYLRQQRFDAAQALLQEALERDPGDMGLLWLLAECQVADGQAVAADSSFARLMLMSDEGAAMAVEIARFYYDRGQRQKTIEYYERALEFDAAIPFVLNNLAWTYAEEQQQLERALELVVQALKLAPERVEYWDTYAEICYLLGQPERAIAALRRALQLEAPDEETAVYLQEQMSKFTRALPVSSG